MNFSWLRFVVNIKRESVKILLTGATGYIGKRLLPVLTEQGHEVVCCVRDKTRFHPAIPSNNISVLEVDFLKDPQNHEMLKDIDAAYYLIHSMTSKVSDFSKLEETSVKNFISLIRNTTVRQIIYLGGITNEEKLSKHLSSRKNVEKILSESGIPVTTLRAGIIVGSGSASFEIIRDLVEKLPVMITPKWLNTKHHPIAVRNIIQYLTGVLLKAELYNRSFDVGGPDILTYKEMLLEFAEVRGLKRLIISVPVMTPRLSSYWLYFVTSTSYKLAVNLVDSMKIEVVGKPNDLEKLINIDAVSYKDAVKLAFARIEQNEVVSSWKDSLVSSSNEEKLAEHINIPTYGCFTDKREKEIKTNVDQVMKNIWSIGGKQGWYYADWLWGIRGFLDKLFGGVGLRRGRTNKNEIYSGDTLDFWRVLVADKLNKRLLLYAEMKLPGEAWLEFKIIDKNGTASLQQIATFRPKGLFGRLYWYAVLPFHFFVFDGMANNLTNFEDNYY